MTNTNSDDNVIFIGSKPFMNYVNGIVMQFNSKNMTEVVVSSRGKFISKAVDVSEVVRKKFLKELNLKIKEVKIDSQEFETKEGKKVTVSTMDLVLAK